MAKDIFAAVRASGKTGSKTGNKSTDLESIKGTGPIAIMGGQYEVGPYVKYEKKNKGTGPNGKRMVIRNDDGLPVIAGINIYDGPNLDKSVQRVMSYTGRGAVYIPGSWVPLLWGERTEVFKATVTVINNVVKANS